MKFRKFKRISTLIENNVDMVEVTIPPRWFSSEKERVAVKKTNIGGKVEWRWLDNGDYICKRNSDMLDSFVSSGKDKLILYSTYVDPHPLIP